jgi:low-density lipoprotein receptor-related protein 1 (alpha-2-macroglobulin receptor)
LEKNEFLLIKDEANVEGLAYDTANRQLYWTSYSNSSIKRTNVDVKNMSYIDAIKNGNTLKVETIVQLDVKDHPRAIVVDSCNEFLYWTNWNDQNPSIQRAALNGSLMKSIVTKDIRTPNGLAIDHKTQTLYYADAKVDRIYKCQLGSFDCQVGKISLFFFFEIKLNFSFLSCYLTTLVL